jgi:hypothetical protein
MSVEAGLYQLITQSDTIQAAVGVDKNGTTKACWVLAPQGTSIPFLVLSRVATNDTYAMSGSLGFRNALFQVVAYASDYYTSRRIADTVRKFLADYTGTLPDADSTVVTSVIVEKDWDMNYEEGSKGFIFGGYLQFRVWYRD